MNRGVNCRLTESEKGSLSSMPRKKSVPDQPYTSSGVSRLGLALVEFVGMAIAAYLTMIAFRWIHQGEVPCLRSKLFACDSIVRGMFSKIGPVSIALLGFLYFAGQLVLTALLPRARWVVILKVAGVFAGLLFVAWLRALELVWLKKLCPWCWGVALMTVIEAALTWPLAAPPLPAMRLGGRLVGAVVFLFAFLGMTTAVELIFRPSSGGTTRFFGYKPAQEDLDEVEEKKPPRPPAGTAGKRERDGAKKNQASAKPATPPKAVADASRSRRPESPPGAADVSRTQPQPGNSLYDMGGTAPAAPTPPAATAAAPARVAPAADEPEPPIDLPDVPELMLLQQRGWRMVASTERLETLVRERGPVLLMVYDPFCEECHATMKKGLNSDEVDQLPVTRVAIDQSSLSGQISALVSHVPTLLLLNSQGQALWTHTGRIKSADLVREVTSRLQ